MATHSAKPTQPFEFVLRSEIRQIAANMAQEGYPGQGYPPAEQYAQQSPLQPGFATTSPPPPAGHAEHEGGKKKKRGYAAQAYDFGAGANSTLGGQTQGGGQFPPAQVPAYGGGYGQQPEAQPAYGQAPYGAPMPGTPMVGAPAQGYGSPAPYSGVGYQAPEPGYPGPGAPAAGGVAGITQGMGQMGMGGAAPMAPGVQPGQAPPAGANRPLVLNQLYPTDLLNQPFNVAELDLPPPPIILPPNVRIAICFYV